jgi:hypothetical protein
MNQHPALAPKDIVRRYRSRGLFGGAAVGAVVGLLVSGPNFHEWAAAQSLAVIVAFAVGSAAIGYFFLALLFGASTSAGSSNDEQDEEHDRPKMETTDISAGNGNDGD